MKLMTVVLILGLTSLLPVPRIPPRPNLRW